MELAAFEIREAGMEDVGVLLELSSALFREDAGTRDPWMNLEWPGEYGRRHFADLLGSGRGVCLLAEASGVPVAYLAGYVRERSPLRPVAVAELESMYVREDARGRGIGARLAGAFLGWAGMRGAERASVTAYASNERAIRFYERMGFRPRGFTLERGLG